MSKQFDTFNDAWAGSSEVGVGIHRKHLPLFDRRQIIPTRSLYEFFGLLQRFPHVEPAGGHDDDFSLEIQHALPGDSNRVRSIPGIAIFGSRPFQHLWNPVASAIDGVDPFDECHPRLALICGRLGGDVFDLLPGGRNPFLRRFKAPGSTTKLWIRLEELLEALRRLPKNLRNRAESLQHMADLVTGRATDLTEVLGDEQIGSCPP